MSLVVVADHEEVAAVLRQDPAVVGEGDRRVGGAEGDIEEEVIAQRAIRVNDVNAAVLAVDVDVVLAVDRRGVDAPLETMRVIGDAGHVTLGITDAALGVGVLKVPLRLQVAVELGDVKKDSSLSR